MDIKALRPIIVGKTQTPQPTGTIVRNVDDREAKALIASGYAAEVKSKGDAPENKAKANQEPDEFDTTLDGTVDEVEEAIYDDDRDADWLKTLREREVAGKNRKGVLELIDGYDAG